MVDKIFLESLGSDVELRKPVVESDLNKVEEAFSIMLPDDFKKIMLISNGIFGEYELGLIWPLDKIISTNLEFRNNEEFKELYMPFDSLLFFADLGNGDQFAYPIQGQKIRRDDIFAWVHEDDSRVWVAPDIATYLRWNVEGKISL